MDIYIFMLLPSLLKTMFIFFPILIVRCIICACLNKSKLIEEAVANGHTMTAYLKKTTRLSASMEKRGCIWQI